MKRSLILLCLAIVQVLVFAQDGQLKILSNHPDLSVKIKRCVASGRNLVINLTATNEGYDDINGFKISPAITTAYDDEGNNYKGNNYLINGKVYKLDN